MNFDCELIRFRVRILPICRDFPADRSRFRVEVLFANQFAAIGQGCDFHLIAVQVFERAQTVPAVMDVLRWSGFCLCHLLLIFGKLGEQINSLLCQPKMRIPIFFVNLNESRIFQRKPCFGVSGKQTSLPVVILDCQPCIRLQIRFL